MSLMKTALISIGVIVLFGGAFLFFSGGFIAFIFKNSYEIKDGKVFYHTAGMGLVEVNEADPKTMKELRGGNHDYGQDARTIYFHQHALAGVDPATFEIIDGGRYWSRDKNNIYYGEKPLQGINAANFKLIGSYYGTDGKAIFSGAHKIDADPATFTLLTKEGNLAKDKNVHFYFERRGQMVDGEFVSDEDLKEERSQKGE